MKLNQDKVNNALADFSSRLSIYPSFSIITDYNKRVIGNISQGKKDVDYMTFPENLSNLGHSNKTYLNTSALGNYQFGLAVGASGLSIIIHINDLYFMSVNYIDFDNTITIDQLLNEVLDNFQIVSDSLFDYS